MHKPIIPWDVDGVFTHEGIVWWGKLDKRYLIEVRRTSTRTANLFIFDHSKNDEELFCIEVNLSYGARVGPDVADIAEWKEKVMKFIDNK